MYNHDIDIGFLFFTFSEALVRWKAKLLENAGAAGEGAKKCTVTKMIFKCTSETKDIELDLTGDLNKLKDTPIQVKEGCTYKIKIEFTNGEIVPGLRYITKLKRKGITVDKSNQMMGSFGPGAQFGLTQEDDMPKGMLARGTYKVNSKFIDDDKEVHLEWDWQLKIAKDWE